MWGYLILHFVKTPDMLFFLDARHCLQRCKIWCCFDLKCFFYLNSLLEEANKCILIIRITISHDSIEVSTGEGNYEWHVKIIKVFNNISLWSFLCPTPELSIFLKKMKTRLWIWAQFHFYSAQFVMQMLG